MKNNLYSQCIAHTVSITTLDIHCFHHLINNDVQMCIYNKYITQYMRKILQLQTGMRFLFMISISEEIFVHIIIN